VPGRNCLKIGSGSTMTYALTHEKELLDQSYRPRKWECLKPHVPPPNNLRRPRVHTTREILDAVFYVLKSGCP
jgi:putative transposase